MVRFAILLVLAVLPGCSSYSFYDLSPAPALYARGYQNPYPDVPQALRTTTADVLYVTDRTVAPVTGPRAELPDQTHYGYERSRSLAFGAIVVDFGKDLTWDHLVADSTSAERRAEHHLSIASARELCRFPVTPDQTEVKDGEVVTTEECAAECRRCDQTFRDEMQRRLSAASTPDAYIFIHGYNCEFEWPAYVIAQIWHFMGRPGVPIAYSWPSGSPGLLRGYQYDRESGEFTVHHLKRFLKVLGSVPGLRRVCIVSHSRGTDVLSTALRELTLELGGPRKATEALKLDTIVYAAADLDTEVAVQRFAAEGLFETGKRVVFYVHKDDEALGTSSWLFSSTSRLGRLRPGQIRPEGMAFLNAFKRLEIIDTRVTTPKMLSHSYFYAHPAVCSDMILLLRDGRAAGDGRPLERDPSGLWILKADYPQF